MQITPLKQPLRPKRFLRALEAQGYRLRVTPLLRTRDETSGTVKERTLYKYTADKQFPTKHLICVEGNIFAVDDELRCSAQLHLSESVLKRWLRPSVRGDWDFGKGFKFEKGLVTMAVLWQIIALEEIVPVDVEEDIQLRFV